MRNSVETKNIFNEKDFYLSLFENGKDYSGKFRRRLISFISTKEKIQEEIEQMGFEISFSDLLSTAGDKDSSLFQKDLEALDLNTTVGDDFNIATSLDGLNDRIDKIKKVNKSFDLETLLESYDYSQYQASLESDGLDSYNTKRKILLLSLKLDYLERILVSRGIISEVLTSSEELKPWGEVKLSENNMNRLDGERKSLYIDGKLFTYNKVLEFLDISDVGTDGKRVLTIEYKEENKRKILIDNQGRVYNQNGKKDFLDISEADTLGNRFIKVNKRKKSKNPFSREEIEIGEEYVYIYIDKEGKRIFLENDNGKKISEFANIRLERNGYKWFELYKKDQTKLTSSNSIIAVDTDGKKVVSINTLKSEFYNNQGSFSFDGSGKLILK